MQSARRTPVVIALAGGRRPRVPLVDPDRDRLGIPLALLGITIAACAEGDCGTSYGGF
jgi:hypothetical protein